MNSILQNKTKNITATAFSAFYAVMIILNFNSDLFVNQNIQKIVNFLLSNILPLFLPVLIIAFISLKNKTFAFKKWLLPVAFGLLLIKNSITLCLTILNSFSSFGEKLPTQLLILLICSLVSFVALLGMFIGTLFDFKYITLLKYGALIQAIVFAFTLVFEFIRLGGFQYFETISLSGYSQQLLPTFIISTTKALSQIMFYIGIFILTTNKKLKTN